MLLLVENGSVYTDALASHLTAQEISFDRVPWDRLDSGMCDAADRIMLSGRRANDRGMNVVNHRLVRRAESCGIPLLGICYGAEIIALSAGGTIRRMTDTIRGMMRLDISAENPLCSGNISVFESHRYEIANTGRTIVIASSGTGAPEIIRLGGSIFGTQFHPEMSDDGREIITRFCSL